LCVHRDNGLVLLDVDCCVSPLQNLSSFSSELLERFDGAYVELSGSGYGLHIVARGVLPSGYRHVVRVGGFPRGRKQAQLEVYHDRKFLRITGDAIRNPDRIGDCQDGLDWLYRILLKPLERPHLDTPSLPVREDATVLGALRRVRGFNELYEHGAGPGDDHSALDWRLICLIVEHGTRDAEQAADIFRQSALYRPSGKGPRYIETTVEKALRRTGWKSAMEVAV